ncbi:MAG: hypothetical protein L0Z62_36635 [Gemmataceae bacterium]|nr:hypothetical protein [Gemmataceae bacterium]
MTKVRSQSLVIDASVARAAGPEAATYPTAKHCRDFLLAVSNICHRMVFTQAIEAEWDNHQSGFARRWRRSMFARKKIDRLKVPADAIFRDQLERAAVTEKQKGALLKDAHLIEAARAQGMRIIALDDTVRQYFQKVAVSVAPLRNVCWVNPVHQAEEPLEWLQAGAPANDFRKLGSVSADE